MEFLTIQVGSSRWLAGLVVGMHGFAAAMFWLVPLPYWLVVLLMPVFVASAWFILRRDVFRTMPWSMIALRINEECQCEFQTRIGEWHDAQLLGSSFVAPYFTILNLKPVEGHFVKHLVIFPDAVNSDDFRKLRVWLKWRCSRADKS